MKMEMPLLNFIFFGLFQKYLVYLDSNHIQQIRYFDSPNGQVHPDDKLEAKDRKLQGFRWLDIYRARKPEELFVMPVPRKEELSMPEIG